MSPKPVRFYNNSIFTPEQKETIISFIAEEIKKKHPEVNNVKDLFRFAEKDLITLSIVFPIFPRSPNLYIFYKSLGTFYAGHAVPVKDAKHFIAPLNQERVATFTYEGKFRDRQALDRHILAVTDEDSV
jgi:hypothetical protein